MRTLGFSLDIQKYMELKLHVIGALITNWSPWKCSLMVSSDRLLKLNRVEFSSAWKAKRATYMDINTVSRAFKLQSILLTNAEKHHLRLRSRTSNAAFCTVIWLKTLAPSGQTVLSSSLLREKSCAPFNTPRLLTVLKKQKEEKREIEH